MYESQLFAEHQTANNNSPNMKIFIRCKMQDIEKFAY